MGALYAWSIHTVVDGKVVLVIYANTYSFVYVLNKWNKYPQKIVYEKKKHTYFALFCT